MMSGVGVALSLVMLQGIVYDQMQNGDDDFNRDDSGFFYEPCVVSLSLLMCMDVPMRHRPTFMALLQ